MPATAAIVLNAWTLPSNVRHDVIFKVLDALPVHQGALLINDHDPKPLFYQLDAEHPGKFRHEPVVVPQPGQFGVLVVRQPVAGEIPMA